MKAFNRYPATLRQDRGCGLLDELVKREVVHHPSEPFAPVLTSGTKMSVPTAKVRKREVGK